MFIVRQRHIYCNGCGDVGMKNNDFGQFENMSKPKMDFTKFTKIVSSSGRGRGEQTKEPMVNMSLTMLTLNRAFTDRYPQFKKVTFGFYENQILITFYRDGADVISPLSISFSKKAGISHVSFKGVATFLADKTDSINLNAFNYKFKLDMIDPNHGLVRLNEPYNKTKKKVNK